MIVISDPEAIISRALALGAGGADRQEAVQELLSMAAGRREPLESARDHFLARLRADTADYDATNALQLVNSVLPQVDRPTQADA